MPELNPLMPDPSTSLMDAHGSAHNQITALHGKTGEVMGKMTRMGDALSGLAKMGDSVQQDDVIKAAGGLVASGGMSPVEGATVLADMPQGGQALAGWVQQHLASNQAAMEKMGQMHTLARHEMGASGMRLLMHAMQNPGSLVDPGSPSVAPQGANALTPSSPSQGAA